MFKRTAASCKALLTEGGFTMFELVAVVVIVGILTAIAIPIFRESVERKAAEVTDEANVRALNSATTIWVAEDPEKNDPRDHDTGTLRPLLERRLNQGWPVSPTRGRYELENGRWVYRSP